MSTSDVQKLNEGPTEAAPALVVPQPGASSSSSQPVTQVVVTPTQVRRPWRSTVRTIFQGLVGAAAMADPVYQAATNHDPAAATGFAATGLAISAGVTRVMALPGVEAYLRRFLPFLAAAPNPKKES